MGNMMGDPKLVELLDGILLGPYRWRSEWREVVERRAWTRRGKRER
jgi:hypothetical protein